ncbi:hypothetical protein CF68_22520 [Cupriavidus sp. SK-4]|uniref:hypothetical protein n=1 Tax=Cupriavidus sp. SK-4 TaxID=574750 RepID=UPI0004495035|nr:hypothetical protein [Cupriavidus sp. SK-4]EYS96038.1 hypothetical protein CF68_22520 [Cupriavidus sp. SK-4]
MTSRIRKVSADNKSKQNSAARLLAIFSSLQHGRGDRPGTDVWGDVLGIGDDAVPSKERRVLSQLGAIVHEIDLTKEGLANLQVPRDLYGPSLDALAEAASPTAIRATWRNPIQQDYLLCLGWAQHTLPCEGEVIEAAAIEGLRATLQELKDQVASAAFPPALREYLDKSIRTIEEALDDYAISGSLPLVSAIDGLYAEARGRAPALGGAFQSGTESQKSTLRRFGDFAKSAAELVKNVETLGRFTILAWHQVPQALEWIK